MCISFLEGVTNHWFALLGRSLVQNDCRCLCLMPRLFALANSPYIFIAQSICFESRLFIAWNIEEFVRFQWHKLNRCTVTSFMCSGAAIKGSFKKGSPALCSDLPDYIAIINFGWNFFPWITSSSMPKNTSIEKNFTQSHYFLQRIILNQMQRTTILNLNPLNL